jgi:hypothetical protein
MMNASVRALGVAAFLLGAAVGCDQSWDFECKAVWSRGPTELTTTTYTYTDAADEQAATAKCKEDMMKAKPPRANSALCKCTGK